MPRGIAGSGSATITRTARSVTPTARSGTQRQTGMLWQGLTLAYQAKPANNAWGFDVSIRDIDGTEEQLTHLCPKAMGLVQALFNQYGVLNQFASASPVRPISNGTGTLTSQQRASQAAAVARRARSQNKVVDRSTNTLI